MPSQVNVHRARGTAARIGTALVLVLVVLLGLLVLPLGALILIGLGGYLGVRAHRARALPAADPVPGEAPGAPARRFFGLKPSYGLSAACTVTGILVFIAGVAVFSNSTPARPGAPANSAPPASSAPEPPAALPDAAAQPAASPQPVLTEPPVYSAPVPAPASRQTQPSKAPQQPAQLKPVASEPIGPRPPTVAPQPAAPQPGTTKPGTTKPDSASSGGAPYYRTCAEARAAGAAPLHRGDPGYREGLDSDNDGTACEKR